MDFWKVVQSIGNHEFELKKLFDMFPKRIQQGNDLDYLNKEM